MEKKCTGKLFSEFSEKMDHNKNEYGSLINNLNNLKLLF